MSLLRLTAVWIVLFALAFCFAAGPVAGSIDSNATPSGQDKAKALKEVAHNWIDVGTTQLKRGFYEQAEASFLTAHGYQEYLTADEVKKLDENIATAHKAVIEKKTALETLEKARELLKHDQLIKAKSYYEKVRNSPYFTDQERKQIASELKGVDENLDKQKKKITATYNRSVELYKKGELEKARDGFVEVVKSGLNVAGKGQSAEDYLVQIDKVLTAGLKSASSESSSAITKGGNKPSSKQAKNAEQEISEVETMAESHPEVQPGAVEESSAPMQHQQTPPADDAKIKIVRSYTKALVDDTSVKVGYYIGRGELDKAVLAVRNTSDVVQQNRSIIGDDLFTQYTIRLQQLTDKIIKARKSS